jgi:ABC-type glycerol-3-phosphate transport system substrate-binding protein
MSGLRKLLLPSLLLLGIFLTPVVLSPLLSQEEIVLTILTQEWMQDVFNDELFDEFEAAHPGVKVVRVFEPQQNQYFSPFTELDDYLNAAAERAALADVLTVSQWNFTPLETRAGLYLDLRPLAEGDPDLNMEDFLPAALDSFRWDGGMWALPVSVSAELFVYNVEAFDEAGLPYPNDNWTLTDFATAARALATVGDDGEVEIPGATAYSVGLMYRVFSGQRLYDDSTMPFTPRLDTPELTVYDRVAGAGGGGSPQPVR